MLWPSRLRVRRAKPLPHCNAIASENNGIHRCRACHNLALRRTIQRMEHNYIDCVMLAVERWPAPSQSDGPGQRRTDPSHLADLLP